MDPTKLAKWLFELPQRIIWAFVAIVGLTLWGPDRFVTGLGLQEFIDDYRKWIGVAFLVLLGIALPNAVERVREHAVQWWWNRRWRRDAERRLRDLTDDEKRVLRGYVNNNTRTQNLNMTNGVTSGLAAESIIYRASQLSVGSTIFAYNIQPWAWDYLREHPELLEPAPEAVEER